MDLTLEYRDGLTATFTCTAFGGSGAEIEFLWKTITPPFGTQQTGFNFTVETLNANGSITSIATTDILSVEDMANFFLCCVRFNGNNAENCETATISIGKRSIIFKTQIGQIVMK